MLPVWAERYKLQTHKLSEKDAQQAETIAKKVNGALASMSLHEIERGLANSAWFREKFVPMHRINTIEGEQQRFAAEFVGHVKEDREVHERVRATEVRVAELKDTVQEIKEDLRQAAKAVTEEAKALRREMAEGERRIVDAVYALDERRKEPR